MSSRQRLIAGLALVACSSGWSCSSFTEVDDAGGPGGDGPRGDGPALDKPTAGEQLPPEDASLNAKTGPGPWGALPSGFCCDTDSDCRYRDCVDWNGSKMCMDPCGSDDGCAGEVSGLHCETNAGRCEPDAAGQKCTPNDQFKLGSKKLGDCCVATHDGWSGRECEGNRCGAFGDISNPYICTHVCQKPADCVGNFQCLNTGYGYGICGTAAATYTCQ